MKPNVFYTPEMTVDMPGNTSQSPSKPRRFVEALPPDVYNIKGFEPISRHSFYVAHTNGYVDGFFTGQWPQCADAGFEWSEEFARSHTYTVASLYEAILNAFETGFTIAPISGFHHAKPTRGLGFCTFSGQVIASHLVRQKMGVICKGAYVDLDSHHGNSIDDTASWTDMSEYIHSNINPAGHHRIYINNLIKSLDLLRQDPPDYIVYCHGADSLVGDPLGYQQCTDEEWFECTRIVANFAKDNHLPLVLCLFGGYGDQGKILNMHVKDAEIIREIYST